MTIGTSDASRAQAVASRTSANGTSSANASFASNAQNASSSAIGAQAGNETQVASTRAVPANTSASDFFASGISAFTPATNQSTAANFNASDLQVAKATISRVDASDITFSLERQMGLAEITLGSATVPTSAYYLYNGTDYNEFDTNYTWSLVSTTASVTASGSCQGNVPYTSGSRRIAIVKAGTETSFHTGSSSFWCITVSPSSAGSVVSRTAYPIAQTAEPFTLAIGDIYYSDGAVSHSDTHLDATDGKTPIGIVGYIGKNYWTEYNTGSGHGGHALVMCLRRVGANGTSVDGGSVFAWNTNNVDEGRTKVTSSAMIINSSKYTYGSGYMETVALNNSEHPAAQAAASYTTLPAPSDKSTGWFLPTAGQYYAIVHNYGYPSSGWEISGFVSNIYSVTSDITDALEIAANETGYTEFFKSGDLWELTSSKESTTWVIRIDGGVDSTGEYTGEGSFCFGLYSTSPLHSFTDEPVRPFLAF